MKIYLKEQRLLKGFSQKEVASYINTEVSNYNRKENGQVKITRNEWERLAEFLECAVEDIYQTEDVSKYKGKNFSGNI
jgi:transcriptional regulator with XRE-family HTH domain